MPVKLGFSIAWCSGEDPEFPASELLFHSADSKGWCTPRFTQYPQELTLRLDAPARLHQVQLLSHEFKVAARVELLVGTFEGQGHAQQLGPAPAAADPAKAAWRRLGFLTFDPNERSGFTARELKSVALAGVPANLVRLVFHKCHQNEANVYGQVSLVALSLLGEPLAPQPLASITNTGPPAYALPGMAPLPGMAQLPPAAMYLPPAAALPMQPAAPPPPPSPAEAAAALAAELGVDGVTAQRIYELQLQKQQAVQREDYDEAKRLKGVVDRLRAAGGAIAALEAQKGAAVADEDYDTAKQLKLQIDRMRSQAYAAALSGRDASGAANAWLPQGSRRTSALGAAGAAPRPSGDGADLAQPTVTAAADSGDFSSPPTAARQPRPPAASPSGDWNRYDDRPAQAKGAYTFQDADATSTPVAMRRSSQAGTPPASDAGPPPPGFPADLPAPEALSAADAKDAGPLVELAGEYVARCLFSRTWQLREAALQAVARDLQAGRVEAVACGSADAIKTLTRMVQRACKDKVAAVFSAALGTLQAVVAAAAGGGAAPRDLQGALSELLPLLVDKAADLNQRTQEQATNALVALAGVPDAGLRGATATFLRALKPGAAPKVVQSRLALVTLLLPVVGLAGQGGDGFQPEAVMDFACPALGHSAAGVRACAAELVVEVAVAAGPAMLRLLPGNLNAKLRAQIEADLLSRSSGASAAAGSGRQRGAPAAPAAGARQQQAPAAAAAAAAVAAVGPAPKAQQQGPAASAAAAPAPAPAALPPPEEGADPAAYEAEVREREVRLGPTHPDVAEAICNLAILHNQRGDVGAALPLYERALAIWEGVCGPDSPDVAHTLTDIAVIHLEQGRDDLGRPLLQRALGIQERHLGPDHPDVLAIRDVLEEEG